MCKKRRIQCAFFTIYAVDIVQTVQVSQVLSTISFSEVKPFLAFTSSTCASTSCSYVGASTSRITPSARGRSCPSMRASWRCRMSSTAWASCTSTSSIVYPSSPITTALMLKPSRTRPFLIILSEEHLLAVMESDCPFGAYLFI